MSRWQWALVDLALIVLITNAALHAKNSWMYAVLSGQCSTAPQPAQCHPYPMSGIYRVPRPS